MSSEDVELGTLMPQQQKCTRFQVNRVRNDSERRYDVGSAENAVEVNMSTDEGETTDDENNVHSVTDRTRLNSESDAKYGKSFR